MKQIDGRCICHTLYGVRDAYTYNTSIYESPRDARPREVTLHLSGFPDSAYRIQYTNHHFLTARVITGYTDMRSSDLLKYVSLGCNY